MQLNVYVPRDKERVIAALDQAARRLGRQKNELVLDAIETYLDRVPAASTGSVGIFHLGEVHEASRDDLYSGPWERDASSH